MANISSICGRSKFSNHLSITAFNFLLILSCACWPWFSYFLSNEKIILRLAISAQEVQDNTGLSVSLMNKYTESVITGTMEQLLSCWIIFNLFHQYTNYSFPTGKSLLIFLTFLRGSESSNLRSIHSIGILSPVIKHYLGKLPGRQLQSGRHFKKVLGGGWAFQYKSNYHFQHLFLRLSQRDFYRSNERFFRL